MTGLDLTIDELVEVAVVVTDYDLRPVDVGFDIVIRPTEAALAQMNQVVREMHTSSGLLDALPGGVTLADAESQVLE